MKWIMLSKDGMIGEFTETSITYASKFLLGTKTPSLNKKRLYWLFSPNRQLIPQCDLSATTGNYLGRSSRLHAGCGSDR
mgnify:FL=1